MGKLIKNSQLWRTSIQRVRLVLSILVLFFFALHSAHLIHWSLIEEIDNYFYDVRLKATMPNTIDRRIVIVDIDERSLQEQGRWPWRRDKLATLVNQLFDDYQIKTMGFSAVFAENDDLSAVQAISQINELISKSEKGIDPEISEQLDKMKSQWQTDIILAESLVARDIVLGLIFKQELYENESTGVGILPKPIINREQAYLLQLPFYEPKGFISNLADIQNATENGGYFDFPGGQDVTRKATLLQRYNGAIYGSLAFSVARLAMGNPPVQFEFSQGDFQNALSLESLRVGDVRIPVDEHLSTYIPYRGSQGSFPYVSATDVLKSNVDPAILNSAIVLVGASAAGLLDLHATPVADNYIGIEIHANIISAILDGRFLHHPVYTQGIEQFLLIINTLLITFFMPSMLAVMSIRFITSLIIINIGVNFSFWFFGSMVLPLASILMLVVISSFLHINYAFLIESRRKRHLAGLFGQYIPTELVSELDQEEAEISLAGEVRNMSVLFSDVRSFTTISEGMEPRELTQMMNEFLTPVTQSIHENLGTVDKYIGDAVMAFWGAPLHDENHASHAVAASLAILEAMDQIKPQFAQRGWPDIRIGVGINSGNMNVGNMGSRFRMAYTVLGDAVNLGSRLEGLTKIYGVDIIVSETTALQAPQYCYREVDRVRVRGKKRPVKIYEPIGLNQNISEPQRAELSAHHNALTFYRTQKWIDAKNMFTELHDRYPHSIYTIYLQRIELFLENPPQDPWDGVYTVLSK